MARQNNYPIFENNSTVITAEFLNGLVNNVKTLNQEDGVFDISIANAVSGVPTTYNSLELALSGTSIPVDVRKGGMTVKFINSTSRKYEQWNLKASSWSTNTSDWALDVDGSVTDGKLKVPFELVNPDAQTPVTRAECVGYGANSNVKEKITLSLLGNTINLLNPSSNTGVLMGNSREEGTISDTYESFGPISVISGHTYKLYKDDLTSPNANNAKIYDNGVWIESKIQNAEIVIPSGLTSPVVYLTNLKGSNAFDFEKFMFVDITDGEPQIFFPYYINEYQNESLYSELDVSLVGINFTAEAAGFVVIKMPIKAGVTYVAEKQGTFSTVAVTSLYKYDRYAAQTVRVEVFTSSNFSEKLSFTPSTDASYLAIYFNSAGTINVHRDSQYVNLSLVDKISKQKMQSGIIFVPENSYINVITSTKKINIPNTTRIFYLNTTIKFDATELDGSDIQYFGVLVYDTNTSALALKSKPAYTDILLGAFNWGGYASFYCNHYRINGVDYVNKIVEENVNAIVSNLKGNIDFSVQTDGDTLKFSNQTKGIVGGHSYKILIPELPTETVTSTATHLGILYYNGSDENYLANWNIGEDIPSSVEVTLPLDATQLRFRVRADAGTRNFSYVDLGGDTILANKYNIEKAANQSFGFNKGKTMSIFGGSWVYNFGNTGSDVFGLLSSQNGITAEAIGHIGAGYIAEGNDGYTIVEAIEEATSSGATAKDIYLLWFSTNDFNTNKSIGNYNDYTIIDNYDVSKKTAMCGAINYCINRISTFAPNAKIYAILSPRVFSQPYFFDTNILRTDWNGTYQDYIDAEREVCELNSIPYMEVQYSFNPANCDAYFYSDKLHPNAQGYLRMLQMQILDFLKN